MKRIFNKKINTGITLIALVITILLHYDEIIKVSNNNDVYDRHCNFYHNITP